MSLDAWKQIPFLRLHRERSWVEDISDDDIPLKQDTTDTHTDDSSSDGEREDISYEVFVFPAEFYTELQGGNLLTALESFVSLPFIQASISDLRVQLHAEDTHTRWRMFRKNIYLYSLWRIPEEEAFSVFVHEFWHYYDIHTLVPTRFWNMSERFYELSWQDIDVLRPWLSTSDFVSGYAMTNMYEDFAESYTYYVLHNASFREKKSQSPILRQKYDFFERYTFPQKQFFNRRFATDERVLPYYWDITKIEIDIEKFLQYTNLYL